MTTKYQKLICTYGDACRVEAEDGSWLQVDIADGTITTSQYGLGCGNREMETGAGSEINISEIMVFLARVLAYRHMGNIFAKGESGEIE